MKRDPDTPAEPGGEPASDLSNADERFLTDLGGRVRLLRERRGMSRKLLARESRVSERYLAQLEAGNGNISVMLLRRVAAALGVPLADVLAPERDDDAVRQGVRRLLERVPLHRLDDVIARLASDFGDANDGRRERIALIGLRGAGKSTLGAMLADALRVPLIELNAEVARESGLPVSEVIALYGAVAYRRIERRVFERIARERRRAVIVAGGGIVHDEQAFDLLLANCHTIWIKARPDEHMARVLAQGDLRPMAGNDEAMEDLTRMLDAREPMYRRADDVVDTSGETPQQSFARLEAIVAPLLAGTS
jgi:XRE family transcriptional regulator, aerobic/anaerobic benzoate catabolism transcriptional regulator